MLKIQSLNVLRGFAVNKRFLLLGMVLILAGCGSSQKSGDVNYTDSTAPIVTLVGGSAITHELGNAFVDPGSSVSDDRDASLVASVSGTVDTTTPGDYVLTYSVADYSGNVATATRVVTVVDTTNPVVTAPEDISVGAIKAH